MEEKAEASAAGLVLSGYAKVPRLKICAVCCREFMGRGRGVYCGGTCKKRAYRSRQGGKLMPKAEVVRVLRVIEYQGTRGWVERQLELGIHGTKVVTTENGVVCKIMTATLGVVPEILAAADLAVALEEIAAAEQ